MTIQRRAVAADAYGDSRGTDTWADVATVRASIEPLRGREFLAAKQVQSELTHRIRMRYSSDTASITPKDRIKFGTRIFDIVSVMNVGERNRLVEIMANES